jgi:hypothetical protein
VNFFGRWQRGSISWWGVVLGAVFLVGCYLVFDVLDLDASDLKNQLLSDAIAPQGAWVEAERGLHQSRVATGAPNPGVLFIHPLPDSRFLGTLPHAASVPVNSQVHWIRPRAHAGRDCLNPSSSPDDLPRTIARAA